MAASFPFFPFSLRDGTPAENLADHTSAPAKSERSQKLRQLGREKRLAFHRQFVGEELNVLVENRRDRATGLAVGMSDNYIKTLFDVLKDHF